MRQELNVFDLVSAEELSDRFLNSLYVLDIIDTRQPAALLHFRDWQRTENLGPDSTTRIATECDPCELEVIVFLERENAVRLYAKHVLKL